MFHDSVLRLAYCGDFTFKEIFAELADELSPKSDHDSGNESGNEDLEGTGLLDNDTDSDVENNYKEAADNEHSHNKQSIEKYTQDHGDQHQTQDHGDQHQTQVHGNLQQTQDSNNVDVKPPVLAKFKFAQETIEISSDSDNGDVPDKQENELEADNDDCILDRVVQVGHGLFEHG